MAILPNTCKCVRICVCMYVGVCVYNHNRRKMGEHVYVCVYYKIYYFIVLASLLTLSSYFLCHPEVMLFILTLETQILHIPWFLAIATSSSTYLHI